MTIFKKSLFTVFPIVVFFLIALASNPSKKTFKNAEKWIPDDFEPGKTTLLIEKFNVSKKAELQMEDYMSEKYPYKYEFVPLNTIKNREGKYADTKLYRYALVISTDTHTFTKEQGASTTSGLTVTGFDFNFYDRSTDKNYPKTKKASSYAIMTFKPVINSILKKFE